MRCPIRTRPALARVGNPAAMWNCSLLFFCIFWIVVCSAPADAARSRQLRKAVAPPDFLLPPGGLGGIADGSLPRALGERRFTLRHIYHHGIQQYPNLHRFLDVPAGARLQVTDDLGATVVDGPEDLVANAQSMNIQRLAKRGHSDIDALLDHAYLHGRAVELPATAWTEDEIAGPNVTDKQTILTFARMAANAYVTKRGDGEWQPVKGGFNYTDDFGWEADGLRGHIFADEKNQTVVIGLKGTSPAVFDGADTTGNDKLNDNLFGSCCCGQGGDLLWKSVCDCMTGTYSCNSTCLVKSLREKGHYYRSVRELYSNVTERYPTSQVWLAGHSLGGVVSSLLGLTYGLPTITYEAFPDAMAASRLGLPTPPEYKIGSHQARAKTGIYHIGHSADPIFMGSCNGLSSPCSIAGYAFQGLCHTGQTCIYDTVNDLGWRVGIGTHKIISVIRDVLEKYDTVPGCDTDVDCQDCLLWKFHEGDGRETTTTARTKTSTIATRTRTVTCKTPGWWGCLDETTTTGVSTTTTSITTSTCKTPGWFGCNDPTTTTTTSGTKPPTASPAPSITSTSSDPTSTTKCKTPGWFGCNDHPSTTAIITTSPRPSHPITTTTAVETGSCTSREWFGLICVDPSPATFPPASKPSSSHLPTARRKQCIHRLWYGACQEWQSDGIDPKNDL